MKGREIKEAFYMVESQIMRITIALLACIAFMKLFTGSYEPWDWYFPFQILGVSIPTGLCSFIFYSKVELNRKQFLLRVVIHFFAIISIVLGEGYFFSWWDSPLGMLIVLLVFFCVYAAVWIATSIWDKRDSQRINAALKKRNEKNEG